MKFDVRDFVRDGFGQSFLFFLALLTVDLVSGELYIATSAGAIVSTEDGAAAYWFIIFTYVLFMIASLYSYFHYRKRKLELSQRKRRNKSQ